MSGVWLYLRLAFGLAVVLAPGIAIARALGVRGTAASLSWALTAIFGAMALTFLLSSSLTFTLLLILLVGGIALKHALRRPWPMPIKGAGAVGAAGVLLGLLLWHVAGNIGGDGFFHLARMQKLLAFDDLSLGSVEEFTDGGPHPGYAFPLWHGFLALIAKVSGATPAEVVLHLPSVMAPLALIVAYEAGWAVFRRTVPAATAAAAGLAIVAMAPAFGGAWTALALPATSSRQILVPAAIALVIETTRRPSRQMLASAAAAGLVLAVVHPTYAIFIWIPLAGYMLVRWLWEHESLRVDGVALAAVVVPAAAFFVWLLPTIDSTRSVSPDVDERERALAQYAGQLDVHSQHSFSVTPELFGRGGAVAVAALLLTPFAAFASRRRWAAYAVGGAAAIFVVTLVPWIFAPFSDLVSLSQSRRLAGFFPFGIALAGGVGVLAALIGRWVLPLALGSAILFQFIYPGDFGYTLEHGGPAWATWIAVVGCVVALVVGRSRRPPVEVTAALASVLLLAPTYVHGLTHWTPSPARPPNPLSEGLVYALTHVVPAGATVYSSPEASYRISAAAPVYACVISPGHVADTAANRPRERVKEYQRFVKTQNLSIPKACGATWIVVDKRRFDLDLPKGVVFDDDRWALYKL